MSSQIPAPDARSTAGAGPFDPLAAHYRVPDGHFDELLTPSRGLRPGWQQFANAASDLTAETLAHAARHVAHQIHENGVTYNIYAAATGPSRPWNLDVLPALITAEEWEPLDRGLRQRARLLNEVAADLYGAQQLVSDRVIPAPLVLNHPGFLRACHGITPPGGMYLHLVAFDLVRAPDGRWHVGGTRVQAPSGLGYALENRAVIARLFPEVARGLGVRPLTPFCDALQDTLLDHAPIGDDTPSAVLLTPGRFNETYFEHVYLARELGIPLVQGGDLTVRHDRVFLKTVSGLRAVHAIWRRVDDDYCDPLELRADSTLGIPGLVQAWRAGRVLVANAFGMSVLEAPALSEFLPTICTRLLGEALEMPSVLESFLALSHAPVWQDGAIESRAIAVRVFLLADGRGDYQLMPGGLCRVAGEDRQVVSSQRGGSSKDTWAMSAAPFDSTAVAESVPQPAVAPSIERTTSSRAAETLFWLGRYAERSENAARLLRAALGCIAGTASRPPSFEALLLRTCFAHGLLLASDLPADPADQSPDTMLALERALIAGLHDHDTRRSLRFNVEETVRVAETVRDRLSSDNWRVLGRLATRIATHPPTPLDLNDTLAIIDDVILSLVAAAGLEMAHMTRDDGWRFLSLGRHLERLTFVAATLDAVESEHATGEPTVLEWLLDLSDSLITYRARHLRRPEWPAVVDLLLFDERNPRSAMFQVAKLGKHVRLLPDANLIDVIEEIDSAQRAASRATTGQGQLFEGAAAPESLPRACQRLALGLSDALTLRYFSHVYERPRAVVAR